MKRDYMMGYLAGYMRKQAAESDKPSTALTAAAVGAGGVAGATTALTDDRVLRALNDMDIGAIANKLTSVGKASLPAVKTGAVRLAGAAAPLDLTGLPFNIATNALSDPDMDKEGPVNYKSPWSPRTMGANINKNIEHTMARPMGLGAAWHGISDPVSLAGGIGKGLYGTGAALVNAYRPRSNGRRTR